MLRKSNDLKLQLVHQINDPNKKIKRKQLDIRLFESVGVIYARQTNHERRDEEVRLG